MRRHMGQAVALSEIKFCSRVAQNLCLLSQGQHMRAKLHLETRTQLAAGLRLVSFGRSEKCEKACAKVVYMPRVVWMHPSCKASEFIVRLPRGAKMIVGWL